MTAEDHGLDHEVGQGGALVSHGGDVVIPVGVLPAQEPAPRPVAKYLFGPSWSVSTSTLLERLGLADLARYHPDDAFSLLEQGGDTQDLMDCQRLLALAELADKAGQTRGSGERLWSRDASVYAVFCLTRAGADQSGMAIGCAARDVHNHALARCLWLRANTSVYVAGASGPRGWPGLESSRPRQFPNGRRLGLTASSPPTNLPSTSPGRTRLCAKTGSASL